MSFLSPSEKIPPPLPPPPISKKTENPKPLDELIKAQGAKLKHVEIKASSSSILGRVVTPFENSCEKISQLNALEFIPYAKDSNENASWETFIGKAQSKGRKAEVFSRKRSEFIEIETTIDRYKEDKSIFDWENLTNSAFLTLFLTTKLNRSEKAFIAEKVKVNILEKKNSFSIKSLKLILESAPCSSLEELENLLRTLPIKDLLHAMSLTESDQNILSKEIYQMAISAILKERPEEDLLLAKDVISSEMIQRNKRIIIDFKRIVSNGPYKKTNEEKVDSKNWLIEWEKKDKQIQNKSQPSDHLGIYRQILEFIMPFNFDEFSLIKDKYESAKPIRWYDALGECLVHEICGFKA